MAQATLERVEHYRAYRPKPFTREERDGATILFGGLTWRHERLIQGVFENLGYRAQPLPNISRADLDVGKELIDTGACCPTTFTTGNLVGFLRDEAKRIGADEVNRKYVYATAGSCGACRFGQYHASYELALRNVGLGDFRILLLAQDQLDQGASAGGGLEMNMPMNFGLVWAILVGDLVTDLEFLIRPYEVTPGTTERAARESVEHLFEAFRRRPAKGKKWGTLAWHLATGYFTSALREVNAKFAAIEVDRLRPKPKVGITGEFWLPTHEGDGNHNIKQWLEQEGAEVIPPAVAVWLDYGMKWVRITLEQRLGVEKGARARARLVRGLQRVFRWNYDRLRAALGGLPYALPSQDELQELAAPYYHHHLSGGEGFMLAGKALYNHLRNKAHMTCELSPYACLPNTMSIGAMAGVLGKHPDLLYAAIEVKGDAEVHALSRCQMVLTEAKKRAFREFDQALTTTGLTIDRIREFERHHPEVRRATYRVPHSGAAAGSAANYVLHVADRLGLGANRAGAGH
jgi:predicted nucleotide-binding protein (sugar kinase/HSP70/actin superfamily)